MNSQRRLPRRLRGGRRALVLPAAFAAATALVSSASTASAAPDTPWHVVGNVQMRIMDHEDFGKNPVCNYNIPIDHRGTGQLPQSFWWFGKCGGEVRAEIHYSLSGQADGSVWVAGPAYVQLYEGASDTTRDLDGQVQWVPYSVLGPTIAKGGPPLTKSFHVTNAAEGEPDDKVDLTITMRAV
ncbi:hypothetical protein [Streptomyces sp. CO7]